MADVFIPHSETNNGEEQRSLRVETPAEGQEKSHSVRTDNTNIDSTETNTYLRTQVAKKHREVQRERALRRAAERRELKVTPSEEYVDPYAGSNPSVNEELKERLSTKAQLNRLLGERQSMEGLSQSGHGRENSKAYRQSTGSLPHKMGEQGTTGETTHRDADAQKHNHTPSENYPPGQNKTAPHGPWYEESHLYPPPGSVTIHAPWLSPHKVVHFDPSPPHSWPEGSGGYQNESSGPSSHQTPSPLGPYDGRSAPMHSTPNKASWQDRSFGIPVGIQVSRPMQEEATEGARVEGEQTERHFDVVNSDVSDGLPFLIDELGSTKDLNKELAEKLSEAEKEIESLQIKQELFEAMMEAEVAAKGAALVEEIFAAQKQHDEAILGRMRAAYEERDEALDRAKMSEDGFDSGTDVNSNEEEYSHPDTALRNLVKKLGNSKSHADIRKHGQAIMSHIGGSKDRRNRITSEEMRAIIEEKDAAVTLNKKLEREIIALKKKQEDAHFKRNGAESLKTELKTTKKERDASILQAKKLEEELENLKMYYSLHQSLSQETQLRDQFNSSLVSIEEQVKARDKVLTQTQGENSQLTNQLKAVVSERNSLAAKVQQLEQKNAIIKQENQKQERLVSVLRRKMIEQAVKTVN